MQALEFDLPEDKIALRPVEPRDASKLLVRDERGIVDATFRELAHFLRAGDHLVLNNTKVIPSRLRGIRRRDHSGGEALAKIELTLSEKTASGWKAFARPAKRLRIGDVITLENASRIRVTEKIGAEVRITEVDDGALGYASLHQLGEMPLPPYIAKKRPVDLRDLRDYQSIFAKEEGAVAAPTASLHFTEAVFDHLREKGVTWSFVTLHVGAGTFAPLKVEDLESHKLHSEWFELTEDTADRIHKIWASGGRVIPVGTTALRVLESAAQSPRRLKAQARDTDLFIKPGYQFRAADGLITNFHLPQSSLILLVAALIGEKETKALYWHALEKAYRFFSYGDASLLWPD